MIFYVFDDISGPIWAIDLELAPNSQVNFTLLGFRQVKSPSAGKNKLKIEKKMMRGRLCDAINPNILTNNSWTKWATEPTKITNCSPTDTLEKRCSQFLCILFKIIEKNNVTALNGRAISVYRAFPTGIFKNRFFSPKNHSFGIDCFRFCRSPMDQKKNPSTELFQYTHIQYISWNILHRLLASRGFWQLLKHEKTN